MSPTDLELPGGRSRSCFVNVGTKLLQMLFWSRLISDVLSTKLIHISIHKHGKLSLKHINLNSEMQEKLGKGYL